MLRAGWDRPCHKARWKVGGHRVSVEPDVQSSNCKAATRAFWGSPGSAGSPVNGCDGFGTWFPEIIAMCSSLSMILAIVEHLHPSCLFLIATFGEQGVGSGSALAALSRTSQRSHSRGRG